MRGVICGITLKIVKSRQMLKSRKISESIGEVDKSLKYNTRSNVIHTVTIYFSVNSFYYRSFKLQLWHMSVKAFFLVSLEVLILSLFEYFFA